MRRDLLKRLEIVESQLGANEDQPTIWLSRPNENNEHPPPAGWTENGHPDPVTVMREPGESEESLRARAIAAFKARADRHPLAAAVFISIHSPG